MISFGEWLELKEIAVAGDVEVPERPSLRGTSRLAPDPMVGKLFGMVLRPSTLLMVKAFVNTSNGRPWAVKRVLDTMDDDVLIMSNEDMEAFRSLAAEMKTSGQAEIVKAAGDDILRSLAGAVEEAMGGKFRKGEAR